MKIMKRFLLAGFTAAGGMLATGAQAADLVLTSYGGVWETATRECFAEPFQAKTGKTVELVLGSPAQWMNQIGASPANPPIHVIINGIDDVKESISRGLVEPFTADNTPRMAELGQRFVDLGEGHGAGFVYSAMGIAYNKTAVDSAPTSWKQISEDVLAGKIRLGIPGINYPSSSAHTLWLWSHVAGGDTANMKPGFDLIAAMRKSGNLVVWNDPNQFLGLLKTGEIDMGMYWQGRTWTFHDDGNPQVEFVAPEPGAVINPVVVQVAKNSPPEAWQLVDLLLSPEGQGCFGNKIQYGTSNPGVVYRPEVAARIAAPDALLWPPYNEINPLVSQWVETWNKEIGQ